MIAFIKYFYCHPERSEGSQEITRDSSPRISKRNSKVQNDNIRITYRFLAASIFFQFFFVADLYAFTKPQSSKDSSLPSILKADTVEGDKINNVLLANGNVEVTRGDSVVYADQIFYYKNDATFKAIGNVKIKNIEIGNVKATKAEIKEDFSSGTFSDSTLVLNDGSYLLSPEVERENPEVTNLKSSIYSICPNPEISKDNELAGKKRDMISIKSKNFIIDRKEQVFKVKGGIIRFYDVPFFYTPYLSAPLPSKERKSGFLHPAYSKNSRLGIGLKVPYYFNIAPNKELTVSPTFYLSTGQILLDNEFHHLASYGEYTTNLELANNQVNQSTNVLNSKQNTDPYRWNLKGVGVFNFTNNTGLDFDVNTTSDDGYLRDYHYDYRGYSLSKINLDYINRRDYYGVQTLRFQEYENLTAEKTDPFILPRIDTRTQLKSFSKKDKIFISTNTAAINREGGLQYRRFSAIPEVDLPFNYNGNLFNLNGKFQGDFYSLENNYKYSTPTNYYDSTKTNYKPEISLNWRLPLVKKAESRTIIIEPMVNLVSSSFKTNFNKLPNEDSNNNELTISNLFVSDRISGFDRNESGTRMSYGVRSS
ncbi:MAG: LPS assembly protein LptD, partial [Rickettsiales bacterium]|nr:LPS assembly protein LptD [Rickettsiales bacterium]